MRSRVTSGLSSSLAVVLLFATSCLDDCEPGLTSEDCPPNFNTTSRCTSGVEVPLKLNRDVLVNVSASRAANNWLTLKGCESGIVRVQKSLDGVEFVGSPFVAELNECSSELSPENGVVSGGGVIGRDDSSEVTTVNLGREGLTYYMVSNNLDLACATAGFIFTLLECPSGGLGDDDDDGETGDDDDVLDDDDATDTDDDDDATGDDDDATGDDDDATGDDDDVTGDDDDATGDDDDATGDDDDVTGDDDDVTGGDDDDACATAFDPVNDVKTVLLVNTSVFLGGVVCFEDPCDDSVIGGPFFDERAENGWGERYVMPGVKLPVGRPVRIRSYSYGDMMSERGSIACVGDGFTNFSHVTTPPAELATARENALVVFAGVDPEQLNPTVYPTTCGPAPATSCPTELKPRFFVFDEACEPSPSVAKVRAINVSAQFASVRVTHTDFDLGDEREFSLARLGYGEATAFKSMGPNAQTLLADTWTAYALDGAEDKQIGLASLGFDTTVDYSTAKFPSAGTCTTVVVHVRGESLSANVFLVSENPLLCEPTRNDEVPPVLFPTCGD